MKDPKQIIALELCLKKIQKIMESYKQRARKTNLPRKACEEMQAAINSSLEEVFSTCVTNERPPPHTITGQGTSQIKYYS